MQPKARGFFLTFEGVEGCGKTTQLRLLEQWLLGHGRTIVLTREPGGTPFGLEIRRILLDPQGPPREPLSELLLYLSDRHHHIRTLVEPALEAGHVVLCDRYHDATVAYQGYARGIPLGTVRALAAPLGLLRPDATLLLDLDPEVALERALRRNRENGVDDVEGRFEAESLSFHRRVREGYLQLAAAEPDRFLVIDSARSPEEVHADIVRKLVDISERAFAISDRRKRDES